MINNILYGLEKFNPKDRDKEMFLAKKQIEEWARNVESSVINTRTLSEISDAKKRQIRNIAALIYHVVKTEPDLSTNLWLGYRRMLIQQLECLFCSEIQKIQSLELNDFHNYSPLEVTKIILQSIELNKGG